MTQVIDRPPVSDRPPSRAEKAVPEHPHYVLGTLVALGVLGTLAAVILAVVSLGITAGRNSVDDALVAERVDEYLAEAGASAATGEVIPALVPKANLPVASEVAVATAPSMPPPTGRTTPAIV